VESNSDHAANLSTELAGLNNTHRGFFIETWGSRNILGKFMSTSQGLTNNYDALYVGGSTALST
jgi:hypothetical protein